MYASSLDLNLLRVFAVVADTGSVTRAASRLYLTQPAVSAAIRRLNQSVGASLFTRSGRGIVLTSRGKQLHAVVRVHLGALAEAVGTQAVFDPKTVERTVRIGLGDSSASWLLPRLVRYMADAAPKLVFVAVPVQFRTVGDAFARGDVDLAVAVADELPDAIARETLFRGGFVCLHDPRSQKLPARLTKEVYLAKPHVVVSYNGDTRGLVEDLYGVRRNVRVSVATFDVIGALVDGSDLVATVPRLVAREIQRTRPHLRVRDVPFELEGAATDLLYARATDDDDALAFVRRVVAEIARTYDAGSRSGVRAKRA